MLSVILAISTDHKALQSFLGITGFCRDFTSVYVELAQPLYDLVKPAHLEWETEHTETAYQLKQLWEVLLQ